MITKLVAYMAIITAAVAISIVTMIYGWGLTPKNWWVIIGAGIIGNTILRGLLDVVNKEDKNEKSRSTKK